MLSEQTLKDIRAELDRLQGEIDYIESKRSNLYAVLVTYGATEWEQPHTNKPLDGMKHCAKCETDKPKAQFSKNRTKYDGLQSWCKDCRAIEDALRPSHAPKTAPDPDPDPDPEPEPGPQPEEWPEPQSIAAPEVIAAPAQLIALKHCSRCKFDRPLEEFHRNQTNT